MKTSYTEKLLDRAQKMWDEGLANITPLQEPDQFGMVKLRYQEFRRLIAERRKLSWANGVFDALAAVSIDESRERRKNVDSKLH
jgi:hypothetical protein